ncbi:MAG: hypothetical protein ACRDUX_17700 [Mycobacterium sp.]
MEIIRQTIAVLFVLLPFGITMLPLAWLYRYRDTTDLAFHRTVHRVYAVLIVVVLMPLTLLGPGLFLLMLAAVVWVTSGFIIKMRTRPLLTEEQRSPSV